MGILLKLQCTSLPHSFVVKLDGLASWGESAGAVSAALHMVANDGDTEGLFRAAFMESGSPIPVGDIMNGQKCVSLALFKSH